MSDASPALPGSDQRLDADGLPFVVEGITTATVRWGRHVFPVQYAWTWERCGEDMVGTYRAIGAASGAAPLVFVQPGRFGHSRDLMLRLRAHACAEAEPLPS